MGFCGDLLLLWSIDHESVSEVPDHGLVSKKKFFLPNLVNNNIWWSKFFSPVFVIKNSVIRILVIKNSVIRILVIKKFFWRFLWSKIRWSRFWWSKFFFGGFFYQSAQQIRIFSDQNIMKKRCFIILFKFNYFIFFYNILTYLK